MSGAGLAAKRRLLTDEQARMVRLSMESHKAVAAALGCEASMIQRLREGSTYGPLRPDERAAQDRRVHRAAHPDEFRLDDHLLAVGRISSLEMHDQDRQEAMDAMYECEHGRLSHDRTPACGCWPGELGLLIELSDAPIPELEEVAA